MKLSGPQCTSQMPGPSQGVLSEPLEIWHKEAPTQSCKRVCSSAAQVLHCAGGAAQASSQAVATDVQKAVATALAKAFAAVLGSNSSSGSGAASGPSAGK